MRIEAKRVIIGMLKEAAAKEREKTPEQKKQYQEEFKQLKELVLAEVQKDITKYLCVTEYLNVDDKREECNKLINKLRKQFPALKEDETKHEYINFTALDINVIVYGADQIRKFKNLAKQIDNAFVDGDAVDLVNLIKKALG